MSFVMPLDKLTVTSPFGPRGGGLHTGVDLRARYVPCYAVESGKILLSEFVTRADGAPSYGEAIYLLGDSGVEWRYAHLHLRNVLRGQRVEAGRKIAETGNSGRSSAPHLHFERRIDGKPTDPWPHIREFSDPREVNMSPEQERKLYRRLDNLETTIKTMAEALAGGRLDYYNNRNLLAAIRRELDDDRQ